MDERSERIAGQFETPLLVAAVATIPVTILQLLPTPPPWPTIAEALNWTIWLVFLAEVVVMLAVVRSKRGWLRSTQSPKFSAMQKTSCAPLRTSSAPLGRT